MQRLTGQKRLNQKRSHQKRFSLRYSFWLMITMLGLASLSCGCNSNSRKIKINGGGSTFVMPMMQDWIDAYENEITQGSKDKVMIDYQGGGSGTEIKQMTEKVLFYGCSDAPMNREQIEIAKKQGGDVIHIPLVIGAVVLSYNLPDIHEPIVLSGEVIAKIFLRKIEFWNDPEIQKLNPKLQFPKDLGITPIVRADASGTSNVFTEYLVKVSKDFGKVVKPSTTPNWPNALTKERESNGVIQAVAKTPGAICYVELNYALQNKIGVAKVINQSGKEIAPDLDSITAAAEACLDKNQTMEPYSLHSLTYSLTNAPGENSYPISTLSYCIFYQKLEKKNGKALVDFLRWCSTDGQKLVGKKDYAPMPPSLQKQIVQRLTEVKFIEQ